METQYEEEDDEILGDTDTRDFDEDEEYEEPSIKTNQRSSPDDFPISDLGVTEGIKQRLLIQGLKTLGDVQKHSIRYYEGLSGMGRTKVDMLVTAMNAWGLQLPEKEPLLPVESFPSKSVERRVTLQRKEKEGEPIRTRDIQPDRNGKYPCPECGLLWRNRLSLAQHRGYVHDLPSPHVNKTWYKRLHPDVGQKGGKRGRRKPNTVTDPRDTGILTKDVQPKYGFYPCPECGYKSKTKLTLGTHRKMRHGIVGLKINKKKKVVNYGRRDNIRRNATNDQRVQPIEPTRPATHSIPEDNDDARHYTEFSIGYAVGHIKTWIDFYCQQAGGKLSADELTHRVASLLLR